jgi:hypothetical protein
MNLVQVDENTIVDKDKVYALVGSKYDGKSYTDVYINVGNKDKAFLVKGDIKDVGALLMEDNDGRVC